MNFKPGDKVWIIVPGECSYLQPGLYAGVCVRPEYGYAPGCWVVDIEGHYPPLGKEFASQEQYMERRDDPPPQQAPKRDEVGDWELCPWRPVSVPKESA